MSWPTCARDGCSTVLGSNWKIERVQVEELTLDIVPNGDAARTINAAAYCSLDCTYWALHFSGRVDVVTAPEDRPVREEPF